MKDENEERFHRVFSVEVEREQHAATKKYLDDVAAAVCRREGQDGWTYVPGTLADEIRALHEKVKDARKNGIIEGLRDAAEIANNVETKYFILDTVILRIRNRANELEEK